VPTKFNSSQQPLYRNQQRTTLANIDQQKPTNNEQNSTDAVLRDVQNSVVEHKENVRRWPLRCNLFLTSSIR
jgi:hypothetical protein